ncbi:PCRF domain-containing protein, partial [Leptospira borgpetersenii serovar Balcanica]|nr:PCRF domain-containing protein [Leptospira borgpetersenii serovar Balcanica]
SELSEITSLWQRYRQAETDKQDALEMINEASDPEMKAMMQEEIDSAADDIAAMEEELNVMMLPKDPNDKVPAFLEIRAGTGGDEAAIFSGDLFRMYERYASSQGWTIEVLSANEGEHGGYKEIITRVSGNDVYG